VDRRAPAPCRRPRSSIAAATWRARNAAEHARLYHRRRDRIEARHVEPSLLGWAVQAAPGAFLERRQPARHDESLEEQPSMLGSTTAGTTGAKRGM
jgi:hypothetical protein